MTRKIKQIPREQVLVFLIILVFGTLYTQNLTGWLINDDEGSFLYQIWCMNTGERPYVDFLSSRDPLFLYFGATWMHVLGDNIFTMRIAAIIATLLTAYLVALITRFFSTQMAVFSVLIFFMHPDIVSYGRMFYPEAFYLLFVTLGLYLVMHAERKVQKHWLIFSGCAYALATLFKMTGILSLSGIAAYLIMGWLKRQYDFRQMLSKGLYIGLPFILIAGSGILAFYHWVPGYAQGVIGVNFAQGSQLSLGEIIVKGMTFLIVYVISNTTFVLLASAASVGEKDNSVLSLLLWQLPTALGFTLLSRELYNRLLYYLIPTMAILYTVTLTFLQKRTKPVMILVLMAMLILPWLSTDTILLSRKESATQEIVDMIQSYAEPDTLVLAGYQELNYHSRRKSTYSGAEISYVIVDGQSITGQELITEMNGQDVGLVLMDVSPSSGHHLNALHDLDMFMDYLAEEYQLLDTIEREGQLIQIYKKQ